MGAGQPGTHREARIAVWAANGDIGRGLSVSATMHHAGGERNVPHTHVPVTHPCTQSAATQDICIRPRHTWMPDED